MTAVRALLDEGTFHESTVGQIAERAGVSRATLYLHFRSRMALIDAVCETISENEEFIGMIAGLQADDPVEALQRVVAGSVRFHTSEEGLHRHLYGLAEIDPAAAAFVARQTSDRRLGIGGLIKRLRSAGRLKSGMREREAASSLLLITSPRTFTELRQSAGLEPKEIEKLLLRLAEESLLGPKPSSQHFG